ncbi:MAG: hypothetical protein COB24_10190 [Hyphomicrobiales bacterium]|nr:MAG: hypothetical protein COB24_10190 [Hyphomicrobiales bacterium]
MLLNYLYDKYYERSAFCAAANIDLQTLDKWESANLVPKASYIMDNDLQVKSFVADHQETQKYEFYLKGQLEWLAQIADKNITTENAARHYFETQYGFAIERFLATELGQKIAEIYPQSAWNLDDYTETWQHFLVGTYGLCTRSGLPNEIFLKHVYIRFIKFVTQTNRPNEIKLKLLDMLSQAVEALDKVESDFAPHEVAQSSRQRCIINIRKNYL